jgi:cyclopropane fatty-acyl-phospholipid synthase-like methyltransferase
MNMNSTDKPYSRFDHDAHARSRPDDDFWGQIRRTVGGKPVSEEQIAMIVQAIRSALNFNSQDVLLDLACGNGALASRMFGDLKSYCGVDFSERLIDIGKKYFEKLPDFIFEKNGVADYARQEQNPRRFTKVLCYGSFAYFSEAEAQSVLKALFDVFVNVERIFIGNLPDRDRAIKFYGAEKLNPIELSDHTSQIGIWRSQQEFIDLAAGAGWHCRFSKMPEEFYAHHYRYDVLLTRQPK